MIRLKPMSFHKAFADAFVGVEYGEATTRRRKPGDRAYRGIGNPFPLLLIRLPDSVVIFYEREAALAEADASFTAEAFGGGKD